MDIDSRTGLVLEGGGMRAIFTVGVLDCFMDHDIWFPYTIGVSAGASNGISYASRQRGRSRFSNIDLLEKYDYIGFRHFLRGRGNTFFIFIRKNIIRSTTRRISSRRTASSWSPAIA